MKTLVQGTINRRLAPIYGCCWIGSTLAMISARDSDWICLSLAVKASFWLTLTLLSWSLSS